MRRVALVPLCAAIVACALASCTSVPKSKYESVAWGLLEKEQTYSAPMALLPEMEIYGLRITLLPRPPDSATAADPSARTISMPATAPAGVDLGNGLAIDVAGNVFLDIVKLLGIDKSRPFDITYGSLRLWRDEDGLWYSTGSARELPVELTETSEHIIGSGGKSGYERTGSVYRYAPSFALQVGFELTVSPRAIAARAFRPLQYADWTIARDGPSIDFSGLFEVRKTGDCYSIRPVAPAAGRPVYTLYVAERALYFCSGDRVRMAIEILPDAILVNGKKAVSYSAPSGG